MGLTLLKPFRWLALGLSVPLMLWTGWLWWEYWQLVNYHSFSVMPDWGMPGELIAMPVLLTVYLPVLLLAFRNPSV